MLETQERHSRNTADKTENAEHADDQQRKKKNEKNGKSGSVALSGVPLGDMEFGVGPVPQVSPLKHALV